jgi:hypothetical protein
MVDDKHRMPTTIGSEIAVTADDGSLLGFIGETKGDEGVRFYARPCHDKNLATGTQWFDSQEEAKRFLRDSID